MCILAAEELCGDEVVRAAKRIGDVAACADGPLFVLTKIGVLVVLLDVSLGPGHGRRRGCFFGFRLGDIWLGDGQGVGLDEELAF